MDVREKLVELLYEAEEWADHKCDELDCETCYAGKMKGNCVQKLMVDRLIAHGVTVQDNTEISEELLKQLRNEPITILQEEPTVEVVQEWISVKDRLPEDGQIVLTYKNGICDIQTYEARRNGWLCKGWFWSMATVTHWMTMPQPPKGE